MPLISKVLRQSEKNRGFAMTANEIRQQFFKYFEGMGHKIVPSAPIVNKNDPTLMFTNAGMNQFKDYFLGNKTPEVRRMADTQKCLRVSGKHNDLEEVGIDSYHHTMFEMLGNWSFGDYFKKEAIGWAWELLTEVYGLPADRLYASVFEGDESDGLSPDKEAADIWKGYVAEDRILYFDRKDNFDVGPCGPCSEIHVDLRSEEERKRVPGRDLVNMDHPLVVEIWNLVFIQYNRKADGSLEELPEKHIDTGMGFERLCMAIQGTKSNYDTDLFTPFITQLEEETGISYNGSYELTAKKDIAFRVIVDHIRAVSFAIADGQLPSNTGAGYVIRRILRRAVRYYFSFLDRKQPLLHLLLPLLTERFGAVFPELSSQQDFITKIILEEEKSFLRTLEGGLKRLSQMNLEKGNELDGRTAFELYDTFGFPIDLTRLIGQEQGWTLDEEKFEEALEEQKSRGRADARKESGDWHEVSEVDTIEFIGYDHLEADDIRIVKHRTVKQKDKEIYHLVLDRTPFYAESGGQVGDRGKITAGEESIKVINTQKENDLIVHHVDRLPSDMKASFRGQVDRSRRLLTENNHTATHLMHAALREVLGNHVQQRGSLVNDRQLRFDFSHFEKMTDEEIAKVEQIVNEKIRANIPKGEQRNVSIQQAKESGAMMLFGEKYGDFVRMITFDPSFSVELCGGCHVSATGNLGYFKIKSESAIASGVRRIEAVTAVGANKYADGLISELEGVKALFKNPTNVTKQIQDLISSQKTAEKALATLKAEKASGMKDELLTKVEEINGLKVLTTQLEGLDMDGLKSLAYSLEQSMGEGVILLGLAAGEKANLLLLISKSLVNDQLNAGTIIRQIAKHIQGGGGGQPFFATAGGKNPDGIPDALSALRELLA